LQNLGTAARQATLTIQSPEDQLRRFSDVSGFGCCLGTTIELSRFLFQPLAISGRGRISGWRSCRSLLCRHHQGAEGRHCTGTKGSFKTMSRANARPM
jgi:hypothetical protein